MLAVRRALKIGGLALVVLALALAILLFASYFQLSQARAEQRRENPDGRNHVCMPSLIVGNEVYCFALGGGV